MSTPNGPTFLPHPTPAVTPAAPVQTSEQQDAALKAELDALTDTTTKARNVGPNEEPLVFEEVPAPKMKPGTASSVDEENAKATPAIQEVEPDEQGEQGEEDEAKPKAKKTVAERISELRHKQGTAERERDAERARADALEARLGALERGEKPPAAPKKTAAEPAQDTAGKPDPSKFQYGELDEGYLDAMADWRVDQKLKARDAAAAEARATEEARARVKTLETARDTLVERGTEEFGEAYFETVIATALQGKYPMSETMAMLTLESDVGHRVAHYLATHPKEAREIHGLSPAKQAARFGRLEAQFSADSAAQPTQQQPARTPRVPAPPSHQARGAGGQFAAKADTTDFDQFERMANENLRGPR